MGTNEIKIETGERRKFSTGATKQASSGKGRPSLVPGDAILEVSKHSEEGATIHGERNWEKGIPLSVWLDSAERHLQQLKMGMTDEPHARAFAWNALVYLATKLRIEKGLLPAELDDMPKYLLKQELLSDTEIKEIFVGKEEPAEDEERSDITEDGLLFCNAIGCFRRGFPKKGNIRYCCPKHKEGN